MEVAKYAKNAKFCFGAENEARNQLAGKKNMTWPRVFGKLNLCCAKPVDKHTHFVFKTRNKVHKEQVEYGILI